MATIKEIVGGITVVGLFAAGQAIAQSLGIGYEAGCLISLAPVLAGAGILGINHLVKKGRKNTSSPSVSSSDLSGSMGKLDTSDPHIGHDIK